MSKARSLRREVLPIPNVKQITLPTYDAKDPNTKFSPIAALRPPAGAPNVLVILLDDVGFGASMSGAAQRTMTIPSALRSDLVSRWLGNSDPRFTRKAQ